MLSDRIELHRQLAETQAARRKAEMQAFDSESGLTTVQG